MSDELDGCECVWSHEVAMRRLLTWIRQSQTTCTDTECLDLTQPSQTQAGNEGENFTMMTMFFLFAVILYFIRPSAFMGSSRDQKPQQQPPPGGQGPNDGTPPAVN